MNLVKRLIIILTILSIMGCNQYENNMNASDSLENNLYETEELNIENETSNSEVSTEESNLETINIEETTEETLPSFTVNELNKVMWAKSYVNVRNYPGIIGNRIGGLKLAQPVRVLGLTSLGWYLVEYNGNNGYVSGNYLLDEEPQTEQVVTQQSINNSLADSQLESMITFHDGVPHETQVAAYQYWSMMPEQTRAKIHDNGWTIEVVNSRYLDDYYGEASSVVGITMHSRKHILMGNSVKHMRRALNHELGHAIDCIYNWPSDSIEWNNIWLSEKDSMEIQEKFDNHPISNTTEFFAECVSQYIQYNDILYRTCPKAYKYISKYVY